MKQQDIFDLAAAYLAEDPRALDTADLRRRAPGILAASVIELEPLDREVSEVPCRSYPTYGELSEMTAEFPLHERLAAVCALRAASHLILDENPALSARLSEEYEAMRANVIRSLPAHVAPILNKYGTGRRGGWQKRKQLLP